MSTTNKLRLVFAGIFVVCIIIAVLYYIDVLHIGGGHADFWMDTAVMCITIILIPFGLKLLHFKTIKARIANDEKCYYRWAVTRLCIMAVPLFLNLSQYYAQDMKATPGYMALMVAIAMCFIWPSDERMNYEREA